jgi:hypothetical protein
VAFSLPAAIPVKQLLNIHNPGGILRNFDPHRCSQAADLKAGQGIHPPKITLPHIAVMGLRFFDFSGIRVQSGERFVAVGFGSETSRKLEKGRQYGLHPWLDEGGVSLPHAAARPPLGDGLVIFPG